MAGDAKFRWHDDMQADKSMPQLHRWIVSYCGIRYAKASEGFLICVTQKTIAANLGVARETVNRAFGSARERGWVRRVAQRQRGTGHHGADTWALSGLRELSDSGVTQPAELSDSQDHSCVTPRAELSDRAKASTSENDVPKGIKKGLKEGYGSADPPSPSLIPEEEPGPHCPAHMPNGTRLPCGACGTLRAERLAWEEGEKVRRAKRAKLRRDTIDACPRCDENGQIELDDGSIAKCDCWKGIAA
jgi:hypothetical protein